IGRMAFLNGSGFLRLVLDRYVGSHAYLIYPQDNGAARPRSAELLALGLADGATSAVIVSSFSPHASDAARPVSLELPSGMLDGSRPLKSIRYSQSSNVQARIRADLAADNNLRPDFGGCPLCLASPIQMARDADRARAMLARNRGNYVEVIMDNLPWHTEVRGLSRDSPQIAVAHPVAAVSFRQYRKDAVGDVEPHIIELKLALADIVVDPQTAAGLQRSPDLFREALQLEHAVGTILGQNQIVGAR